MNKEVRPIIDDNKLGKNPLANDFEIKASQLVFKDSFKKDNNDWLHATNIVEQDKSTKVYIKSEYRKIISNLTAGSKSLFLWLIYEADNNKDYIWINKTRYMEENSITSINTYKKAVNELVRYCVIYPMLGKRNVYWINPRLMFNGNRITKYPDNIKIVNE